MCVCSLELWATFNNKSTCAEQQEQSGNYKQLGMLKAKSYFNILYLVLFMSAMCILYN